MGKGVILLAAGGTGGHLFPAEALAHELKRRGWQVHLATDHRAGHLAGTFPAEEVHQIASATIASRNPVVLLRTLFRLWRGLRQASALLARLGPGVVIGFGGYPTVPPLFAATRRAIPSIIHEQNAVMGRANRALAARVDAIAGGFLNETASRFPDKTVTTGNPVRPAVMDAARTAYAVPGPDAPFRLLVFGGSQGARFFSDIVPETIATLSAERRARLQITQQVRPEDAARVAARYEALGVQAQISPFFVDLPAHMAAAHLVVSRAGASSVLELSIMGRPAILVPLPHSLDDDQGHNGDILVRAGGAIMHRQEEASAARLGEEIGLLMEDGPRLAAMAQAAGSVGRPEATRLLADLAEAIAAGRSIADVKKGFAS